MRATLRTWICLAVMGIAGQGFAAPSPWPKPAPPPIPPLAPIAGVPAGAEPAMIQANEMAYDRAQGLVIARGRVQVMQGTQILQADQVSYQQSTDIVRADGHVVLLQPDGNVIFANHAVLRRELRQGIVSNFRARMLDNSIFAAREAKKLSPTVTVMKHGVYSPCKIASCREAKAQGKAPLWQIRASRIKIDDDVQEVSYRNAFMEVYGVPVLYTPYLSHPTPSAPAEQGFLAPSYSHNTNLGYVVKTPYYIPLAPDYDITLTPIYTSIEGPVMKADYRQLTTRGYYELDGSITDADRRDGGGNLTQGSEIRGHIKGKGFFQLNPVWDTGFDFKRATDDTYMRKYGFDQDLTLTSRAYVEGIKDRTYANLQAVTFQGLEVGDRQGQEPLALPYLRYQTETKPGWQGSRFHVAANTLAITRSDGTDMQRLSTTTGWKLPLITPGGQVFEFNTQLRADGYNVSNLALAGNQTFDGTVSRVVPEASLAWRYPLQKPLTDTIHWVFEPEVGVAVSTSGGNSSKIPNEDSAVIEFTDTNLLSFNRYTGWDRVETGPRAYYGLHNTLQFNDGTTLDTLIGQNYQQDDSIFPFTNTLNDHFSDYVGRISVANEWLNAAYRFRLSQTDLALNRQEALAYYYYKRNFIGINYIDLAKDAYIDEDRREANLEAGLGLTDSWSITSSFRRDIERGHNIAAGAALHFHNECLDWLLVGQRDFTYDRDIQPNTSFITQIIFRNIN